MIENFRYAYIMHPVVAIVLAWVIDHPVSPKKCYILAITRGIQALPDMYALFPRAVGHTYQARPSCPCYNYYL